MRFLILATLLLPCAARAADPDAMAAATVGRMRPVERTILTHGIMALPISPNFKLPKGAVLGAGFIPGIQRLAVPPLVETDASLGVAYVNGIRPGAGATALPASLAEAASFDADLAYRAGAMVGEEARRTGFDVLLGGGADLARDPRNGRNFEYLGEDPLLAGTLAGAAIAGTQSRHVISTLKHYALNDQETGRSVLNAVIDPAAARESDLLAFEIAVERGHPGAVMCAYNRVDGPFSCDSDWLLNQVLKQDWHFPGFVMSDWGAVHDVTFALHGIDQESGEQLDSQVFFADPLQQAAGNSVAMAQRLADMNRRILRSLYDVGARPQAPSSIDFAGDAAIARKVEDEGIVLLRNQGNLLPLTAPRTIAVIGGQADIGVLSGGGSSQVAPKGGPAASIHAGGEGAMAGLRNIFYLPGAPLAAIKAHAPNATVRFDDGRYPAKAAALAKGADIVILFATQWMMEGYDAPDITLPEGQDALIAAVAAANPHTVVVLETGGPVQMPWLDATGAVLEAWYPGIGGGAAIADALFGTTNPAGRLPMTFPASLAQLPRPELPGFTLPDGQGFDVRYDEGSDVGYRWFARTHAAPLFAFGYGLSYTGFSYAGLQVTSGAAPSVSFSVHNDGAREGVDIPQLYLLTAPRRSQQRLLGWSRLVLQPGETRRVGITIDRRLLADWDQGAHGWRIDPGTYRIAVSTAADAPRLQGQFSLDGVRLPP